MADRSEVFICYSHQDTEWLELLEIHLAPIIRDGFILTWSDKKIAPGSLWHIEIASALKRAKLAVLLVSPHFLASDFIAHAELPPLLNAARLEGLRILWIPIRYCSYEDTPLSCYQAAFDPRKPLAELGRAKRDKALVQICKEIKLSAYSDSVESRSNIEGNAAPSYDWNAYLGYIESRNRFVELHGIRRVDSNRSLQMPLDDVYVELYADQFGSRHPRDGHKRAHKPDGSASSEASFRTVPKHGLRIHDVLSESSRVVIVGDPGSGKTTLLRYVAAALARGYLDPIHYGDNARKIFKLESDKALPIPILIQFTTLYQYLRLHEPDSVNIVDALLYSIGKSNKGVSLERLAPEIEKLAIAGELIILIDGIDEVPEHKNRKRGVRIIAELMASFRALRVIATCRIRALTAELASDFGDVSIFRVQAMSWEQVSLFLHRWYQSYFDENIELSYRCAEDLLAEIRGHRHIIQMAINPNVLTLIAILKQTQTKLPERRVDLYSDIIALFLEHKDIAKDISLHWNRTIQELTFNEKKQILSQLAFEMHSKGGIHGTVITENKLTDMFTEWLPALKNLSPSLFAKEIAENLVEWLELRTGLLVRRGGGLAFSHHGYQEYLTASVLATLPTEELWRQIRTKLDDDWWIEVIKLLLALLGSQTESILLRLCGLAADSKEAQSKKQGVRGLALAAGALKDLSQSHISDDVQFRVREALNYLTAKSSGISTADRLDAYNSLGIIGDPRFSVSTLEKWVHIRSKSERDMNINVDAKKAGDVLLGVYPVTNLEFQSFFDDRGYQTATLWSPAGLDWLNGRSEKELSPRFLDDARFNLSNQPVVGISFYEAEAYCRWLFLKLTKGSAASFEGDRSKQQQALRILDVRLPTIDEWALAERGTISSLRRTIEKNHSAMDEQEDGWGLIGSFGVGGVTTEWGGSLFSFEYANLSEAGIGRTTPVGVFVVGDSPCGCSDLVGNVWEWCTDSHGHESGVCGGAWNTKLAELFLTLHRSVRPNSRDEYTGFRCAVIAAKPQQESTAPSQPMPPRSG